MALKSYLIGPFESGLTNNVESWLLPEDAFEFLTNAYVWRGRVRKRFGTYYLGGEELKARLRINIGSTSTPSGDATFIVPGTIFAIGQMFSIGTTIFTVNATGIPAATLTTGAATATFNTTTGTLNVTGNGENPSTAVFFYPAEPVMGLRLRETTNINFENTLGFDTQFAYQRIAESWARIGTGLWTGNNSDFFWSINYRGTNPYETFFYVVNNVPADNIKYLPDGTTTWTTLRPQLNSGGTTRFLETCAILVGFKDRLVALNTTEDEGGNDRVYQNRARWTQNGDPTAAATSWLDDTAGRGGFVDPATDQAIVTVEFIKDRLVVYFERSTWELVYTGEATLPFKWQQLNNELGAESRFSIIGFDSQAVGVGNVGVHSCNGVNVTRIDQKIPDEVFKIHNDNDGPARVYGIRDYFREIVYWTFPSELDDPVFPTKILVWNYKNDTWAFFDDSFTCFGYFQKDADLSWADVGSRYGTWGGWNASWGGAQAQSQFPDIIAGNQQGFVFVAEADLSSAEESLYITDITTASGVLTVINNNLMTNEYVLVTGVLGAAGDDGLNGLVFKVTNLSADTIELQGVTYTGTYTGGGKLTRIAEINISSKQWNPGTQVGLQFTLPYMDILLDRTSQGELSLNYIIDNTATELPGEGSAILGNNILYTKPEDNVQSQEQQSRIWHRYYIQTQAQFLQIRIFLSDAQLRSLPISQESDIQINALILYAEPQGRIIG